MERPLANKIFSLEEKKPIVFHQYNTLPSFLAGLEEKRPHRLFLMLEESFNLNSSIRNNKEWKSKGVVKVGGEKLFIKYMKGFFSCLIKDELNNLFVLRELLEKKNKSMEVQIPYGYYEIDPLRIVGVLSFIEGRALSDIAFSYNEIYHSIQENSHSLENELRLLIIKVLSSLKILHEIGFSHMDLHLRNVLVRDTASDIAFIDFEFMKKADEKSISVDLSSLILSSSRYFSSDLYMIIRESSFEFIGKEYPSSIYLKVENNVEIGEKV